MKIVKLNKAFLISLLIFPLLLQAQLTGKLSNKKASKEATALYTYIKDMFGKKILSGQMYSGWGVRRIQIY